MTLKAMVMSLPGVTNRRSRRESKVLHHVRLQGRPTSRQPHHTWIHRKYGQNTKFWRRTTKDDLVIRVVVGTDPKAVVVSPDIIYKKLWNCFCCTQRCCVSYHNELLPSDSALYSSTGTQLGTVLLSGLLHPRK